MANAMMAPARSEAWNFLRDIPKMIGKLVKPELKSINLTRININELLRYSYNYTSIHQTTQDTILTMILHCAFNNT